MILHCGFTHSIHILNNCIRARNNIIQESKLPKKYKLMYKVHKYLNHNESQDAKIYEP